MQSKPLALFPSLLVLSLRCPSPSKPTRLTSGTHERTRPESPRQLRAQQHWHLPVRPAQGYRSRNLLFGHCGARRRRNIGSVGRWLQRRPNARRHSRRRGCNPRVGKSSTTSPRPTCRKTSSSAGTSRRMPTASLRSSCSTASRACGPSASPRNNSRRAWPPRRSWKSTPLLVAYAGARCQALPQPAPSDPDPRLSRTMLSTLLRRQRGCHRRTGATLPD
mmetsp:Transcript_9957/g.24749  ORF Transcript_9957/g.24749 Transcript_9957/m.24749 type:complete len:220 (+) Transcript_9957:913-1572(+)